MVIFVKLTEKIEQMAKRKKMRGTSARRGNAPSPYSKYAKVPHRYSADYYEWVRSVRSRAAKSTNKYADEAKSERRA